MTAHDISSSMTIEDDSRILSMKFDKRSNRLKTLFKGVGLVGTLVLAFSAFMPDMMNIPQSMRPWLFITFIFWFMSYASGMFTL